MYNGLLHLHNLLRWIILVLLLINIVRHLGGTSKPFTPADKKFGLALLISAHITLLLGLYQYFKGNVGFKLFTVYYPGEIMRNPALRFWAVEHITGMLFGIILITLGYSNLKKNIETSSKRKKMGYLFLAALVIIMVAVPWPFRPGIGRPWFPGMHG